MGARTTLPASRPSGFPAGPGSLLPAFLPASLLAVLLPVLAAQVAAGCGSGPGGGAAGDHPLQILASPESIAIRPRQNREIVFRLVDERGAPVPDRIMKFAIRDDPATREDDARGATLSFDRSITNDDGAVFLQVIAGLPTVFRIRASATHAPDAEAVVFVTSTMHGAAEVIPVLDEDVEPPVASIRVHLYDGPIDGRRCADLPVDSPPPSRVWPVRTVPMDGAAVFSSIASDGSHAILGLAVDAAGGARAAGCVDLPGSFLFLQETTHVRLPLHALRPSPLGTFAATSMLQFRPPLRGATAAVAAVGDLVECPLDPARLWIDCTLDALSGPMPADPIDCRPGSEGALGDRLVARRGTTIAGMPSGKCRDRVDSSGRPSLEVLADGLFATPRPPPLSTLALLPAEARQVFEGIRLRSTVAVTPGSAADRYTVDHRLRGVEFQIAARAVLVDPLELGLPALEARYVPATLRRGDLEIASHGFTLRIGSVALRAFELGSLRPRGTPPDLAAFLATAFGLARAATPTGPATGCAALDAALCAEAGAARGCLLAACTVGLAAMARQIQAAFQAIDGEDLDMFLGGLVPILDRDGDRRADALGALAAPGAPGLWSGDVRSRLGTSPLTAVWTAERAP